MKKVIAGMDLHSNNVVIGVMDMDGRRVAHQKVECKLTESWIDSYDRAALLVLGTAYQTRDTFEQLNNPFAGVIDLILRSRIIDAGEPQFRIDEQGVSRGHKLLLSLKAPGYQPVILHSTVPPETASEYY